MSELKRTDVTSKHAKVHRCTIDEFLHASRNSTEFSIANLFWSPELTPRPTREQGESHCVSVAWKVT
jgi:hypothetical protein